MKILTPFLFLFISLGFVNAQTSLLFEGFETVIMPPTGWFGQNLTGPSAPGTWSRVNSGSGPAQSPHSGIAEAKFNSFIYLSGTSGEVVTPVLNFTTSAIYTADFWMYRDAGNGNDYVEVYVNTAQTSVGGTLIGKVYRNMNLAPAAPSAGWYHYSFTIPATFVTATNYVSFKAVSAFGYNMYIDDINIYQNTLVAPVCVSSFSPADLATGVCTNATINWEVVPFATGYKLTLGNNPPTYNNVVDNVDLGNTFSYSALLSPSSTYKWKLKPYNGVGSPACTAKTFTTSSGVCYCTPHMIEGSCDSQDFIDDFSTTGGITNITNNNTGCSANPDNYTFYNTKIVTANTGTSFNVSMQCGALYLQGFSIWADWNIDGDFDDAGEYVFNSGTPTLSVVNGVVNVPATATTGTTRLRVRSAYNYVLPSNFACETWNEGETEDYTLVVSSCTMVTYYQDLDNDGYGTNAATTESCTGAPAGYAVNNTDCNDANTAIHPGAVELCNGMDENCNVTIDDGAAIATITPSGPTTVCKGTNLTLSANTGAGYTYQWTRNGGNIAGATASTYNVTKSGNYQVKVTVPGGCLAISSTTSCTVNASPNASITTPEGNDLCGLPDLDLVANAGVGFTYLWYKNGALVAGVTTQTYTVSAIGDYRVKVTNAAGCSKTSAVKSVVKTCRMEEPGANETAVLEVFPNPADNYIKVGAAINSIKSGQAELIITDMIGNKVYASTLQIENGAAFETINTADLAAGMYFINLTSGEIFLSQQLVINK